MGECRVNCAGLDRQVFQASIQMASAGPLTLVELRGEGAELDLWRQQSSEMAVLWIPERGWTCDRQGDRGDDMITSTGQGLWIAPGPTCKAASRPPLWECRFWCRARCSRASATG